MIEAIAFIFGVIVIAIAGIIGFIVSVVAIRSAGEDTHNDENNNDVGGYY